jgi:hypothetical protein
VGVAGEEVEDGLLARHEEQGGRLDKTCISSLYLIPTRLFKNEEMAYFERKYHGRFRFIKLYLH